MAKPTTAESFTPHNLAGFDEYFLTVEAAAILRVKPQTMRKWAAYDSGPLKPIRRNGRLLWAGSAIRNCLQG